MAHDHFTLFGPMRTALESFVCFPSISLYSTSSFELDGFLMEINLNDISNLTHFIQNILCSLYSSLIPRCRITLDSSMFSDFLAQTAVYKSVVLTLCVKLLGNLKAI